jgi:hypothetical protein
MQTMLKVLSTIWLSILLATAPLQALSTVETGAESDPCPMHASDDSAMVDEGCPGCSDHNCDGCNHQGCAAFQLQPAKLTQLYHLPVIPAAAPAPVAETDHSSRSTSPLLRPPA